MIFLESNWFETKLFFPPYRTYKEQKNLLKCFPWSEIYQLPFHSSKGKLSPTEPHTLVFENLTSYILMLLKSELEHAYRKKKIEKNISKSFAIQNFTKTSPSSKEKRA
ncbi:hypothetical protein CEXT_342471 [Caerostris extrusa]|uniref:Uncharacterized protein n=1 Tax=Caerostris extrusa TaxID=172846 RepID=A0AAV4SGK2_CAEEX|nr:hypothetical protein CEXT_342471 [Caerostris extrusa]